jgi:hypothetical protein
VIASSTDKPAQAAVIQEAIDRFYWSRGTPCCAGCDWWRPFNLSVGECLASAPVGEQERWAMLRITGCSLSTGAGHVATPRDHFCGSFKDEFDWSTLALPYLKRIGFPVERRQ